MAKSKPLQKGPKVLRDPINAIREDALTAQPIAGDGISIDQHPGQGTVVKINAANSALLGNQLLDLQVCIGGVTKTVTFIVKGAPH